MPIDIHEQDVLTFRKKHACGDSRWQVLRTGMDFRLRCLGCDHEIWLSRVKVEKALKKIERDGATVKKEKIVRYSE